MLVLNSLSIFVAACAVVVAYRTLLQTALPSVAVYAEVDKMRPTIINIVIENMGHAPALDVRFTSSQPIPSEAFGLPGEKMESATPFKEGAFVTGIPVLHPRERRTMTWGQYGGLEHALKDSKLSITAHFTYERPLRLRQGKLSQTSEIFLRSFASEDISEQPILKAARHLERIERHLGAMAATIKSGLARSMGDA